MPRKKIPLPTMTPDEARLCGSLTPADYEAIAKQTKLALEAAKGRVADAMRLAAQSAPPTVTRGERVQSVELVTEGGKILEVPVRSGLGGSCSFIDWLNFTCHESSFKFYGQPVTDDQLIVDVSATLQSILGFGISHKRDKGLNFYNTSYVLGDSFGFVCYGGQRDTVLVQLNGSGLMAAREGWEKKLYEFLNKSTGARITRIDLAYDDYNGQTFSVEGLEATYKQDGFCCGGRNPDIELRGNWHCPNGKGRTVYVGNRTNGKFFRGYEKGKQLGAPESQWVRVEVEFKSVDRFLPYEMLLYPGEFLAAAYPCLYSISVRQERILTIQNSVKSSHERLVRWLRLQCGAALNYLYLVEGDAEKALELVRRDGQLPRGLKIPSIADCGEFLHERIAESLPLEVILEAQFQT